MKRKPLINVIKEVYLLIRLCQINGNKEYLNDALNLLSEWVNCKPIEHDIIRGRYERHRRVSNGENSGSRVTEETTKGNQYSF